MGLRPNQPRRLIAAPPRCRHSEPPVPVEVHDTLDGSPEVVCWLCPSCLDETRPPPPRSRSSVGGLTAQQAGENLRASLSLAPVNRTTWHPYYCDCRLCR